jgi:hypothetical protein
MADNIKQFTTSAGEPVLTIDESKLTLGILNQFRNYIAVKEKEIKSDPSFNKKQKALKFLSENAGMAAGALLGDKYSGEWGSIYPLNNTKSGEITRALRILGINAWVDGYLTFEDGRRRVYKYIAFDYRKRRDSINSLIKMLLDEGLNMKWASVFDPLEEYPTVKDRIDAYGGNRFDLLY